MLFVKVICTLIFTICLCSPAFSAPPGNTGEYPGGTIANLAKALGKDAKKNIKTFVKEKHACRKYAVLNTEHVSMEENTYIDDRGRLLAGSVVERWTIDACGKSLGIGIVFTSDGKKGNYIVIMPLEWHNKPLNSDAGDAGAG